jgi:hypothetical protein
VVAAYQAAEASVRAMKFALTLSLNGDWDRDGVAAGLREDARPWRRQAEKRPDKLRSDILDSEIALADKRPDYVDALEAMQAAHRAETDRIALQLAPEHRKATTAVVRAMEALSRAIADERAVRARLATTAPLQTSAYLPDTSGALGVGELSELNSPAWRWAQELRRAGFGGH